MCTVLDRLLIGWGVVNTENVFVGDSLYLSVFYRAGILGSVLFFLVILRILRHSLYLLNKTFPDASRFVGPAGGQEHEPGGGEVAG